MRRQAEEAAQQKEAELQRAAADAEVRRATEISNAKEAQKKREEELAQQKANDLHVPNTMSLSQKGRRIRACSGSLILDRENVQTNNICFMVQID